MTDLLTAAQMRAIEQAAIDGGAVTGLELMERAGQGVVEAVFEEWPELAEAEGADRGASPSGSPEYLDKNEEGRRAVVLCGPGNNGGDGFVVARLLAELGWAVEVVLYGDPARLPADARVNYQRWCARGRAPRVEDGRLGLRALCEDLAAEPALFIDAFFGTGLNRLVPAALSELYLMVLSGQIVGAEGWFPRDGHRRVVAIDVPSGLCADSGRVLTESGAGRRAVPEQGAGFTARPDLTVTFHALKLGHVLATGPEACGKVVCKDIGLLPARPPSAGPKLVAPDLPWRQYRSNRPNPGNHRPIDPVAKPGSGARKAGRDADAHKFVHGHALVLAGPAGRGGAARLAARAALRVGAGLVTLGCPGAALLEHAAQLTAIMLSEIDDAASLSRALDDARITALALGPGLGQDRARALVPVALGAERPTVLDADALSAYAEDPGALFARLHGASVLTPHAGEFKRLFPDIADTLAAPATKGPAYSKLDATRAAAKRAGCTVLFKGPDTVIASPDGRAAIHAAAYERAAPWLATAGAGDVLAGLIAGLLARGFDPKQAAETAAWLHVEAARNFGPGLIAEDLPEELPKVFRRLDL